MVIKFIFNLVFNSNILTLIISALTFLAVFVSLTAFFGVIQGTLTAIQAFGSLASNVWWSFGLIPRGIAKLFEAPSVVKGELDCYMINNGWTSKVHTKEEFD